MKKLLNGIAAAFGIRKGAHAVGNEHVDMKANGSPSTQNRKERADLDRCEQTVAIWQNLVRVAEETLGPDHEDVADCLARLTLSFMQAGRFAEAALAGERAVAIYEKAPGANHPGVEQCRELLEAVRESDWTAEDAQAMRQRIKAKTKDIGLYDLGLLRTSDQRAAECYSLGQYGAAEKHVRQALAILNKNRCQDPHIMVVRQQNLAVALVAQRRFKEAKKQLKRALALCEKNYSPDHCLPVLLRKEIVLISVLLKGGGYATPDSLAMKGFGAITELISALLKEGECAAPESSAMQGLSSVSRD